MRRVLVLGCLVVVTPAVAAAQPRSGPPPRPDPFQPRQGTATIGSSLGLGFLDSDRNESTYCGNCHYTVMEVDSHVGGMLSEQFGLMLQLQANGLIFDESGDAMGAMTQFAAMIAGQYWPTPKLWLKGGIGVAHVSFHYTDSLEKPTDDGGAMMIGVGYELLQSRSGSIDLQGRFVAGGYDGLDDRITSATIGLGFNWRSRGVIAIR